MIGAAIIAPLRHPLLLAHQLATLDLLAEGRLVVQPTVSWHREEYEALGCRSSTRGEILDEHLAAFIELWRASPASFDGDFFSFHDVYLEPKPFRPDGPRMWFGGMLGGAVDRAAAGRLRPRLSPLRPADRRRDASRSSRRCRPPAVT